MARGAKRLSMSVLISTGTSVSPMMKVPSQPVAREWSMVTESPQDHGQTQCAKRSSHGRWAPRTRGMVVAPHRGASSLLLELSGAFLSVHLEGDVVHAHRTTGVVIDFGTNL